MDNKIDNDLTEDPFVYPLDDPVIVEGVYGTLKNYEYLGCQFCSSVAFCGRHTKDFRELSDRSEAGRQSRIEDEEFITRALPETSYVDALNEEEELKRIVEKQKKERIMKGGRLCSSEMCQCNYTHDVRGSAVGFPGTKIDPIEDFIKAWNAGQVDVETEEMSDEGYLKCEEVFQVNARVSRSGPDMRTYLFRRAVMSEGERFKYWCFSQYDDETLPLSGQGAHSYMFFLCSKHKNFLRVGYEKIKWSTSREWATYGSDTLDKVMKIPWRKKITLGSGGPGYQYSGRYEDEGTDRHFAR